MRLNQALVDGEAKAAADPRLPVALGGVFAERWAKRSGARPRPSSATTIATCVSSCMASMRIGDEAGECRAALPSRLFRTCRTRAVGHDAPDEAALIDFVATQIPRYKRPRFVQFVDALPRTAIGKIQKNRIRAEYWRGRDRAI